MSSVFHLFMPLLLLVGAATPYGLQAQAEPGPPVWNVVEGSQLDVLTRRSGLLSFFGHDHLVRAERFQGTIAWDAARPERASVHLVIEAAGVRVLTSADSSDLATIQRDMELKVLRPEQFPTIEFRSETIEPREDGVRVRGALTLVGVTRPVVVDVTVAEAEPGRLRATGVFEARLSDYGIDPPSAVAGTVKVRDEITFRFDVQAERAPG